MNIDNFQPNSPGRLILNLNGKHSFVPNELPPAIDWSNQLVAVVNKATQAVARLCGLGERFPKPHRLVNLFLRREAELSSRIEQTHASVRTMLFDEAQAGQLPELTAIREVRNNFRILLDGLNAVREQPITASLLKQQHAVLFSNLDAPYANVGQFRTIPVFIGASLDIDHARFVPPPPHEVEGCMRSLLDFVNAESDLPPVVRAALAHYQFETIHPFNDGNGRIGRALIMMMLVRDNLLSVPLLNPSAGLERRRNEYYDLLLSVSQHGRWNDWITFFCECVIDESKSCSRILEQLDDLRVDYHQRIAHVRAAWIHDLVDSLFEDPRLTAAKVAENWKVSAPTAHSTIRELEKNQIIKEVTGRERDRVYFAEEIIALFKTRKPDRR